MAQVDLVVAREVRAEHHRQGVGQVAICLGALPYRYLKHEGFAARRGQTI